MSAEPRETESQRSHREAVRAREIGKIPRWYSPWAHLACTTGIGLAVLAVALWRLHDVRALELLVVPAMFLFANAGEWRAHRDVLHKKLRPLEIIYERHTPMHHVVYVEHDMTIRSTREFRMVLIPAAGVAGIVVVTAPFAALAGWLLTPNCGWLVLVTASLYMVGYELSHLSYHLPPDSFIGRLALVRVLRRHHARHHDPRLMQKWNFNVTIPIWDWVRGTIAPRELQIPEATASAPEPEAGSREPAKPATST